MKSNHFSFPSNLMLFGLLVSIIAYISSYEFSYGTTIEGIAVITDGDTIKLEGHKVRLAGIDAPELKQKCQYLNADWDCGIAARNNFTAKISDKPIECELEKQDRYKRFLGTCFLNGENLNEWMVLSGYAVAYRQYSKKYIASENKARIAKVGIWSSSFEMPQNYRKHKKHSVNELR